MDLNDRIEICEIIKSGEYPKNQYYFLPEDIHRQLSNQSITLNELNDYLIKCWQEGEYIGTNTNQLRIKGLTQQGHHLLSNFN